MDFALPSPSSKIQKLVKGGDEGEDKDIISKLPDSILLYILSFLLTKDAVRTSILSTKWRYLWTGMSNFDFNDDLSYEKTKEKNIELGTCLLKLVDRVLLHDSAHIQKLRLSFDMPVRLIRPYLWVKFAVMRNVQELDLSLPVRATFLLHSSLFTSKSLSKLQLYMDCVLRLPSSICFSALKMLHISVTFLDDQSCQELFSGCPVLQELVLYSCVYKNIKSVTISIPTLRRLTIYECHSAPDDFLNCEIKVYATNLISLSCQTYLTVDLSFCNLSSLVDAFVDVTNWNDKLQAAHRALKLLAGIQGVKSLRISNETLFCVSYAENIRAHIPTFHNLTRLEVYVEPSADPGEYTDETLMDILQKTPSLESLDIPEGLDPRTCLVGEDWILNSVPHCLRYCLKEFSISNFNGKVAEIELLKYLSKNATILERMRIYSSETFEADLKKQEEINNQLQILREGLASCIIEFL
ncbi:F-box/LRR-repeat protein At4g14103-like isoform X3 [Quercus robur]|uniref:F-box/LRR-repeat protein At4g14103-like isoform X3 n=1 Tax=Quercus robur TaxID=38942 RepID=UPI002162E88E|nr:F-box/LRR-repeat protein At4g14103-like isoform X3 [Quercus robur]